MDTERRTNWQISKYQTNKKLIELVDKLKATTPENAPHIHAGKCKETSADGKRHLSCIGIKLLDYSAGTGDKTISVDANILPGQCEWIYAALWRGDKEFKMNQEKIVSSVKDTAGFSPVTKLTVIRAEKGKDGKPRSYPWYIKIENGTGVAVKTGTGGFMIKKDSYKQTSEAFINVNDADMFVLVHGAHSYIKVWELKTGWALLKQQQALL